jgi:hypothetical protein
LVEPGLIAEDQREGRRLELHLETDDARAFRRAIEGMSGLVEKSGMFEYRDQSGEWGPADGIEG